MASRANVDLQFLAGTTSRERVTATAGNHRLLVFGMNAFFHKRLSVEVLLLLSGNRPQILVKTKICRLRKMRRNLRTRNRIGRTRSSQELIRCEGRTLGWVLARSLSLGPNRGKGTAVFLGQHLQSFFPVRAKKMDTVNGGYYP